MNILRIESATQIGDHINKIQEENKKEVCQNQPSTFFSLYDTPSFFANLPLTEQFYAELGSKLLHVGVEKTCKEPDGYEPCGEAIAKFRIQSRVLYA